MWNRVRFDFARPRRRLWSSVRFDFARLRRRPCRVASGSISLVLAVVPMRSRVLGPSRLVGAGVSISFANYQFCLRALLLSERSSPGFRVRVGCRNERVWF